MEEMDLDAIVLTGDWLSSVNYRYLSGHLPRDFQMNLSRPHIFVLDSEGNGSILSLYFSEDHARKTSWVSDITGYSEPFEGSYVVKMLRRLGLGEGRLGWELGTRSRMCMPVSAYQDIVKQLSSAEFVDISGMMHEMRLIKSNEEIDRIRHAAEINGRALKAAYEHPYEDKPSERAVYKQVVQNIIAEHPNPRPPFGQILTMSSSGFRNHGGGLSQYLESEPEQLRVGDLMVADSGTYIDGYWAEYSRMAVVGKPTADMEKKHADVRALVQRSIDEAIRSDATGKEIIEHLVTIHQELGYDERQYGHYLEYPYRHLCHGLGLEASESPLINLNYKDRLQPGMVLAVECSLTFDDIRYCTEETVLVTESGAEILSIEDEGLYSLSPKIITNDTLVY
jgi:Xaa-Pro aminopeptidase